VLRREIEYHGLGIIRVKDLCSVGIIVISGSNKLDCQCEVLIGKITRVSSALRFEVEFYSEVVTTLASSAWRSCSTESSLVLADPRSTMVWQDHLKHEIKMEIKKQGRASLVDLSDSLGVDLYHVERQSKKVVSDDLTLMLINGEIMSQSYWDSVTEEINEKLQERSQIALAEIAAQLHIGSELVINILEPRLGTIVCFSCFSFPIAVVNSLLFFILNSVILMRPAISIIIN
jgi:hypothetical protein